MPKKIRPIQPIPYSPAVLAGKVKAFVNHSSGKGQSHMLCKAMRNAINNNTPVPFSAAVDYAIRKAWVDATMRARTIQGNPVIANANQIKDLLKNELTNNAAAISAGFDAWHDKMCSQTVYGMNYGVCGVWQKFINMTFKYLYCFSNVSSLPFPWTDCHCPVDSVIAEKLLGLMLYYNIPDPGRMVESIANNGSYGVSWNNLTPAQYKQFQDLVADVCRRGGIPSKLFFDFLYW